MAGSYSLRHAQKIAEWSDGTTYHLITHKHNEQHPDDNKYEDDVSQMMIPRQNIVVGTHQSQTPASAWNRLISHMAEPAIHRDMHSALLSCCHLMSQGNHLCIMAGILIGKNGGLEKTRSIRMHQIAPVTANKHEIGIRIGMFLLIDGCSKLTEGEVGGEDAHHLVATQIKRFTVRGDNLWIGKRPLIVVVKGVYPAGLP